MTFTIRALEAEDHKCQGGRVCGAVSHSGVVTAYALGFTARPGLPDSSIGDLSPRKTLDDSSASTPSVVPSCGDHVILGSGRFLLDPTDALLIL